MQIIPKLLLNLKKLRLEFLVCANGTFNESISLIRSESLLEFELISPEHNLTPSDATFAQLGANLPHLKKLHLKLKTSINILNLITKHLPTEEVVFEIIYASQRGQLADDRYIYLNGPVNKTLKKLTI